MVRMFKLEDRSAEFHRENKTVDLVKRIGVITADRVYLTNYPVNSPHWGAGRYLRWALLW